MTHLFSLHIVKIPQIMKILNAGSVKSLSYMSLLSELGAVTFTATYNIGKGFPFRFVREWIMMPQDITGLLRIAHTYSLLHLLSTNFLFLKASEKFSE